MVVITNIIGLWGEEFSVEETPLKNKQILKKSKEKKEIKTVEKAVRSKSLSVDEKMTLIEEDVNRILGSYKTHTQTIRTYNDFVWYINRCISNGVMSIDTETDNSLNTFDCKLMGLCLYSPGLNNAYIPVNHIDRITNELLPSQITEEQIREQLERCSETFKIFHNATFDIEVIKQTCGIKLKADWDTMVGAQLLDENEQKGLKTQYKLHIDPDQDKYDIEHLFKGLPYAIFEPELFALYAATDAWETYKLYEYQKAIFERPENKDVYDLFKNIEIPIIDVVVDMELTGVEVDVDYAKRLSKVYHERSDEIQLRIDDELARLKPIIDNWRQTPEACRSETVEVEAPPNSDGIHTIKKQTKPKTDQLSNPPLLSSPTQMAILLYDVLKCPVVDKKSPRGTGADILEALAEEVPLCKLLVEKRGVDILINTFIDKMPEILQKDSRVHARFNNCGTATGRFSSSDPNL